MAFFYSTCECCKAVANGGFATLPGRRRPVVVTLAQARALLAQESWNDATRGAYRARRRKDETT